MQDVICLIFFIYLVKTQRPCYALSTLKQNLNSAAVPDIKNGQIIIIPVQVEPRYTPQELQAIDKIVADEKNEAKAFQVGKDFERAIEDL